jgi:hypothetical protein
MDSDGHRDVISFDHFQYFTDHITVRSGPPLKIGRFFHSGASDEGFQSNLQ